MLGLDHLPALLPTDPNYLSYSLWGARVPLVGFHPAALLAGIERKRQENGKGQKYERREWDSRTGRRE